MYIPNPMRIKINKYNDTLEATFAFFREKLWTNGVINTTIAPVQKRFY